MVDTDDPNHASRMEIVRSDCSDLEKVEALGLLNFCVADDEPDVFDGFFRDHTIDIRTGELLGRYIAEERDTLRLVQGCTARLQERDTVTAPADDRLGVLEDKIDAACRAIEDLRQIVCAQTMPTPA
jgi:hypothetical protein